MASTTKAVPNTQIFFMKRDGTIASTRKTDLVDLMELIDSKEVKPVFLSQLLSDLRAGLPIDSSRMYANPYANPIEQPNIHECFKFLYNLLRLSDTTVGQKYLTQKMYPSKISSENPFADMYFYQHHGEVLGMNQFHEVEFVGKDLKNLLQLAIKIVVFHNGVSNLIHEFENILKEIPEANMPAREEIQQRIYELDSILDKVEGMDNPEVTNAQDFNNTLDKRLDGFRNEVFDVLRAVYCAPVLAEFKHQIMRIISNFCELIGFAPLETEAQKNMRTKAEFLGRQTSDDEFWEESRRAMSSRPNTPSSGVTYCSAAVVDVEDVGVESEHEPSRIDSPVPWQSA